jgi:cellulose synthase (UDP-forming)
MQVLFSYTPRLIWHYTPRRFFQFIFVQTWYTFWSVSMLILFTAPLVTLATNQPVANTSYWSFLAHILPISAVSSATWFWSRKWHFPKGLRLSWRGVLLHVARWLVVLGALVQVFLRVKKPYMITIKGMENDIPKFPFSVLAPYVGLIGLSLGACWCYIDLYGNGAVQGYLFLALRGVLIFWLMLFVVLAHDLYSLANSRIPFRQVVRARWAAIVTMLIITGFFTTLTYYSVPLIIQALFQNR